jgi:hypothetical protein
LHENRSENKLKKFENKINSLDDRVEDLRICIAKVVIIGIPASKHLLILFDCIERGIPFMLYLPLFLLSGSDISVRGCRLNLIITGASAWFIGNFPAEKYGDGGMYQTKTLEEL